MNPSDLIIRSCDGVDLHTHKTIRVSFSSPVFRDMLAFPEPAGADVNLQRDAKPVTPLPESGRAVEKLFLLCYPSLVGNHLFTDLDGVDEAYPAADKYQLNGGQKRLEEIMPDAHSLTREPHRVYAIACHRGLAELAKTAAKTMLKQSFLLHTFLLIPEYKFVSVHQFVRFQHFRERCIGAMEEVLLEETSTVSAYEAVYLGGVWWRTDGHSLQCGPDMDSDDYVEPAKWFTEHVESIRRSIRSSNSSRAFDIDSAVKSLCKVDGNLLAAMAQCQMCIIGGPTSLHRTATTLAKRINARHAAV